MGLIGLVAAAYSVLLVREASVMPLDEWDAWAIWTVKAKGLATLGHLGTADFVGAWPAYPPLVPVMQSLVFRFVGTVDTQVVHVEYALLLIAFAAAVWRLLSERSSPLFGAVGALVALMLPGLREVGIVAQADLPLAIFITLAAFFLVTWITDRRAVALALFAAFAAFAGWTKNEGSILVLALGVACAVASVSRRPKSILPPLAATATALATPFRGTSGLRFTMRRPIRRSALDSTSGSCGRGFRLRASSPVTSSIDSGAFTGGSALPTCS